jgi:F-type H+-transporting ATPase subunit c
MSDLIALSSAVVSALSSAEAPVAAAASYAPIGQGLVYGLAAAGCGVGIALVAAAAITGTARQPEQKGTLQTMMFLGVGFIEALALIGLLAIFLIK